MYSGNLAKVTTCERPDSLCSKLWMNVCRYASSPRGQGKEQSTGRYTAIFTKAGPHESCV